MVPSTSLSPFHTSIIPTKVHFILLLMLTMMPLLMPTTMPILMPTTMPLLMPTMMPHLMPTMAPLPMQLATCHLRYLATSTPIGCSTIHIFDNTDFKMFYVIFYRNKSLNQLLNSFRCWTVAKFILAFLLG